MARREGVAAAAAEAADGGGRGPGLSRLEARVRWKRFGRAWGSAWMRVEMRREDAER